MEIDSQMTGILDQRSLLLPERPRIESIEVEPYADFTGEDALRVWVWLDEATPDEDRHWVDLEPIERAIRDKLREAGVELFPFIRYVKRSEMHEAAGHG